MDGALGPGRAGRTAARVGLAFWSDENITDLDVGTAAQLRARD